MAATTKRSAEVIGLWVVLVFMGGVVGLGMWFGKDDPDTPWGPIILGAFALMGMITRRLFNIPREAEDDGYGRH